MTESSVSSVLHTRPNNVMRLRGKTLRGKNRIARGGEYWRVVRHDVARVFVMSEKVGEREAFWISQFDPDVEDYARGLIDLIEQLETVLRERDAIGTALGEPCAECGHIDWRSDGYADDIMSRLRAADEAVETAKKERDSWKKVAREYETALADRGAL